MLILLSCAQQTIQIVLANPINNESVKVYQIIGDKKHIAPTNDKGYYELTPESGKEYSIEISFGQHDLFIPNVSKDAKGIFIKQETTLVSNLCYVINEIEGDVVQSTIRNEGECANFHTINIYKTIPKEVTFDQVVIRKSNR